MYADSAGEGHLYVQFYLYGYNMFHLLSKLLWILSIQFAFIQLRSSQETTTGAGKEHKSENEAKKGEGESYELHYVDGIPLNPLNIIPSSSFHVYHGIIAAPIFWFLISLALVNLAPCGFIVQIYLAAENCPLMKLTV